MGKPENELKLLEKVIGKKRGKYYNPTPLKFSQKLNNMNDFIELRSRMGQYKNFQKWRNDNVNLQSTPIPLMYVGNQPKSLSGCPNVTHALFQGML